MLTIIPPCEIFYESALVGFNQLTLLYHFLLVLQRTLNNRIHELLDGVPKGLRRIARKLSQRPKRSERVPLEHDVLNPRECVEERIESAVRFAEGQRIQSLTEEELRGGVRGKPPCEICHVYGLAGLQIR